jgi:RND family efflux transporter MFP subunit
MSHHKSLMMLICLLSLTAFEAMAVEVPGVVQYERVVELSLPVSGVIKTVNVVEGQNVEQGELLLELEAVPFKARKDELESQVRLLQAEKEFTSKELERNKELYDRLSLSTVDLDKSKLDLVRAESKLAAMRAELAVARYQEEKSRLYAPISGKVTERNVEPGQTVRTDLQPPVLLRIADTTGFIVEAEVTGDRLSSVSTGSGLEVRIQGKTFPAVFKSTRLLTPARSLSQPSVYRVRVKLEQSDPSFLPGLPASIIFPG